MTTTDSRALVPDDVGHSLLSLLPQARRDVLRNSVARGASDAELEHLLSVAAHNELDPLSDPPEIYMIERRQQIDGKWVSTWKPRTAYHGILKRLKRWARYCGFKLELRAKGGQWMDEGDWDEGLPDFARATIPVRGWELPVRYTARFSEKAQYTNDGKLTQFWQKMPVHMLCKCALYNAILLLPDFDAEGLEIDEGGDWDSEGSDRRQFFATVSEEEARRALNVPADGSLAARVEEVGGWSRALGLVRGRLPAVHGDRLLLQSSRDGVDQIEAFFDAIRDNGWSEEDARRELLVGDAGWDETAQRYGGWDRMTLVAQGLAAKHAHDAAIDATLPARDPEARASDVLYNEPAPERPMPVGRAIPDATTEATFSEPLTSAPDSSSATEVATACSEEGCGIPANGIGPRGEPLCEAHLRALEQATAGDSGPGSEPGPSEAPVCEVCGAPCQVASFDGEGNPLYGDFCAEHQAAEDEPEVPAMPESVHDLASFVASMEILGATRADLAIFGKSSWNGLDRAEFTARWHRLAAYKREQPASGQGALPGVNP